MRLVFAGECLEGHDPAAVRQAMAVALKLDDERVRLLFRGKRTVLRSGVDAATAYRMVARFATPGCPRARRTRRARCGHDGVLARSGGAARPAS